MPNSGSDAGSKGNATLQIVLAIITVSGVIATALFANWDKVFPVDPSGRGARPVQTADAGTGAAPQSAPAASGPAPATSSPAAAEAPASAYHATPAAPPPAQESDGERPNVSGLYRDEEGYRYAFRQQGSAIIFQQSMNGMVVGQGTGTIEGRAMRYGYVAANNDSGTCEAQLAEAGDAITGRCRSAGGGESWPFTISR